MKSSDATLLQHGNLPRVFVVQLRQDDPKKCTAAKMVRFHFAEPLFRIRRIPRRALVLNPFASKVLLNDDRDEAINFGLVAIDCSWEKVQTAFSHPLPGQNVKLPPLLASNPTNYAKPQRLSSLEALAASLHIMGFQQEAGKLLSTFKWGPTFLSLNRELLEAYALASDEQELQVAESQFF